VGALRVAIPQPSSNEPVDPLLVQLVAGGDCFASIGRRSTLQAARPGLLRLIADRFALAVPLMRTYRVGHEGEHQCRERGNDYQNH